MQTAIALALVLISMIGIMYACNLFEQASSWLGRRMRPGVRGATINAIGSSLPELMITFILVFMYRDLDGFSGGVATTAGSAVFNAVLIPAAVILAVTVWKRSATEIEVSRSTLRRDGAFVLIAELVLIYMLGQNQITWQMTLLPLGIYAVYFGYMALTGMNEEPDDDDFETANGALADAWAAIKGDDVGFIDANGREHKFRAWVFLAVAVFICGAFCHLLAEATTMLAADWGVNLFFTTVIFAAAATSVPDTIISIKDALKGDYDDAVANAIGSNIFDVTCSLMIPAFAYSFFVGPIDMQLGADVQVLRWVMLGFTAVTLALLYRGKVGRKTGYAMVGMYGLWIGFIVVRMMS